MLHQYDNSIFFLVFLFIFILEFMFFSLIFVNYFGILYILETHKKERRVIFFKSDSIKWREDKESLNQ